MPNLNVHCRISEIRTGKEFRELHSWIDEGTKYLKHNHRLERHFFIEEYKDFVKEKWGEKAVVEWLFHIALDNLETANKFALNIYSKTFEEISVSFDDKEISACKFIKKFPSSRKIREIDLTGRRIKETATSQKEGLPEKEFGYTKEELELMGFDDDFADLIGD